MVRDELMKQLAALPPDALIGVRLGDQHLDVVELVPWGDRGFVDLKCHPGDLRDVLTEWELPAQQRESLVEAG